MNASSTVARAMDGSSPDEVPAQTVHIARQPIFDPQLKVVAYELLHRRDRTPDACIEHPARATAEVLVGATLDVGFGRLLGDCPAYVNFPEELILTPPELPLAPERIVIEVLEGVVPSPALLAGLVLLRQRGYRIALDDYDPRQHSAVLLDYADIVKVDIREYSAAALADCVGLLRRRPVVLVAEKVETAQELSHCRSLGFELFQGYFLQRPETFSACRPVSSRVGALQVLAALHDPEASAAQLEGCIARDVGFSYRILRSINSSYYQLPREIRSLRQAITLLGVEELRKICALTMLAEADDRPAYVPVQALVRARMCEQLSVLAGLADQRTYFMTGLLSQLDVLLALPIREALQALPLGAAVREALLSDSGALGAALRCARSYERGEWHEVAFLGLPAAQIAEAYREAISWADVSWGQLQRAR